jgi:hypothetical protein
LFFSEGEPNVSHDPADLIHDYLDGVLADADRDSLIAWLRQDRGNVYRFAVECRLRHGLRKIYVNQGLVQQVADYRQPVLPGPLPIAGHPVSLWFCCVGTAALIGCAAVLLAIAMRPTSGNHGGALWPRMCSHDCAERRSRDSEFRLQPTDSPSIATEDGKPPSRVPSARREPPPPPQPVFVAQAEPAAPFGKDTGEKGGVADQ